MTGGRKWWLWLGLCASLPGASYASLGSVYFVWLEGVRQWAPGRADLFAAASLAMAVLCAGIFIYCLVGLLRNALRASANRQRTA